MDADSTVNNSDDSVEPPDEDPPSARLLASVARPPRPGRRSLSGVGVALAAADGGSGARQAPAGATLPSTKGDEAAPERGSEEPISRHGANLRSGSAGPLDDGWALDAGESLSGETRARGESERPLELSLAGGDPLDDDPGPVRGEIERGIFGDDDENEAQSAFERASAMKEVASGAPPVSFDDAEGSRPAHFPSQAPSDAPEEGPLLLQLSRQTALRAPTKISPPAGVGREDEGWPARVEQMPDPAPVEEMPDASPGVPLGELDEHEATVVGNASKDILELASQEVNTRVFHAPQELIELARRKQKESRHRRERELDTLKPDPARLLADRAASAQKDIPTPVPKTPVFSSDAAPAVASESAPPIARAVARAVDTLRADEARRAQESANPRIEIRTASPESVQRASEDWEPESEEEPAAEPAAPERHWLTEATRWLPFIVCCVLIGYFVVRLIAPFP